MAIGGLQYDGFKPELWSSLLNYSLKKAHVGRMTVNRNYEGEIREQGDVVHILEPGAVTTNAYTAYSDISYEQPSETDRQLTIDQAHYFAFDVDDIDRVQANVPLVSAHMVEASYSIMNQEDAFILGLNMVLAANSGVASDHANPDTPTYANIWDYYVDAGKVLDLQDVPKNGRWSAVSPNEVALIRKSPQFVPISDGSAFAGGGTTASAEQVRSGLVGTFNGFAVLETNNLTTLSGVRKVMFGTQQATTFASQITEVESLRREFRFADGVRGLNVYGMKTIRPEALAVLHVQT